MQAILHPALTTVWVHKRFPIILAEDGEPEKDEDGLVKLPPSGAPRHDIFVEQGVGGSEDSDPDDEDDDGGNPEFENNNSVSDEHVGRRVRLENVHRCAFGAPMFPSLISAASYGPLSQNPEMRYVPTPLRWSPLLHHLYPPRQKAAVWLTFLILKRNAPFLDRPIRVVIVRYVVDGVNDLEEVSRQEARYLAEKAYQELDI